MFSATASATILLARPATDNPQTKWVTIGVTLIYTSGFVPSGNVVLTENGTLLGLVYPPNKCPLPSGVRGPQTFTNVCDMTVMIQNYPLGAHTITASYPGDDRGNAPATLTFTIYVTEAGYLPAVLDTLLSN